MKNLDKILTREPTPELATEQTKQKKYKLKLQQEFMNKIHRFQNPESIVFSKRLN